MPSTASNDLRTALALKLRKRAVVTEVEPVFALLEDTLDDALNEHLPDSAGDFTALKPREHELVILLAWERVCFSRASFYAPQASLNSKSGNVGFGSDRDTPFEKNTKLAKALREQYIALRDNQQANSNEPDNLDPAGDITVGELFRTDDVLGVTVPLTGTPPLLPVKLTLDSAVITGGAIVRWTTCEADDFLDLRILVSSSSGIYQDWNSDGKNGLPYCSADAEQVFKTPNNRGRAIKLVDLPVGSYFVVAVVVSRTNEVAYSNEITFTVA